MLNPGDRLRSWQVPRTRRAAAYLSIVSTMDSPAPRFHVLIARSDDESPWEGDVDAANVCDALEQALRRLLGDEPDKAVVRHVLARRLPDDHS